MKGKKEKEQTQKETKENEVSEEVQIRKKYKRNLLMCLINGLLVVMYFIGLNAINEFAKTQFDTCIKILYMIHIVIAVIMFEIAYKKEKEGYVASGIEFILLALHTMLVGRSITLFNEGSKWFIIYTACIWPVYYCLKAVIIHTKENRRRLKKISDIAEIVKEEKPTKKVAKKRKK